MLEHLRPPQYAKNFHCLGSRCEDNCCRAWNIPIDRATFERYERVPALTVHLREHFALITEGATDGRYALINLNASSTCPFLSADRLCSLQQKYGDSYLSEACTNYPRNPHRLDGLIEQPLSLSCIEAARLVLLNPQLMPRAEPGPARYARFLAMPNQSVAQSGRGFRHFWDIRELCLLLVQDRTYSLWQRLFILGMFCKRLGEMVGSKQFEFVPKLLRDYAEIASTGNLREAMDGIPVRAAAQVQMVAEIAFGYLPLHKPELSRIHECLQEFLNGVGHNSDSSIESCTRRYEEAYTRYYLPFIQEHPFLLENYLINHIFRVVFPFGNEPAQIFQRPEQEYLFLCLEFSVLKGLLIGMAGYYREAFSTDQVVKLVQSLAKSLEHDATLRGVLNWKGLSDANCVAALLKN